MSLEARARAALERGDLAQAAQAAQQLAMTHPDQPAGFFLLGLAAAEAGQVAKALPMLEQAVARGPVAEHLAQYARLLILLRRDGEAGQAARQALALGGGDALTSDTIGCVLARLGDHEASVPPFEAAVAGEPDNLDYRYNLAAACGFTGRVEAARDQYEAILSADPGHARAHYALAILSRQTKAANHVPRLKAALKAATRPDDALRIRYALAKEAEDLGDAPAAFAHLSQANAAHKRAIGYDFAQDAAIFDAIERLFGDRPPRGWGEGLAEDAPLFIVGMPRTGTTLVDRILSSHPDLGSAGELQAMPLAVKQLAGTRSRLVIDPETIAASAAADPAAIGQAYMAAPAIIVRRAKPASSTSCPPISSISAIYCTPCRGRGSSACAATRWTRYGAIIKISSPASQPITPIATILWISPVTICALTGLWRFGSGCFPAGCCNCPMKRWSPIRKGRRGACSPIAGWHGTRPACPSTKTARLLQPQVPRRSADRSTPMPWPAGKRMRRRWPRCGTGWETKG